MASSASSAHTPAKVDFFFGVRNGFDDTKHFGCFRKLAGKMPKQPSRKKRRKNTAPNLQALEGVGVSV